MQAKTRWILSMVKRVTAFEDARPSDDTSHTAIVTTLKALNERIPALVEAELTGHSNERQATQRRTRIRRALLAQARHITVVAELAAASEPDLEGTFIAPTLKVPNQTFLGMVRAMQVQLEANLELLLASGLGLHFPEEFAAGVAAFEEASLLAGESRTAHVGARGNLIATAEECRHLVRVLDGLNTTRYARDADGFTAWQSVSNVYGPVNRAGEKAGEGTEQVTTEPPTSTTGDATSIETAA